MKFFLGHGDGGGRGIAKVCSCLVKFRGFIPHRQARTEHSLFRALLAAILSAALVVHKNRGNIYHAVAVYHMWRSLHMSHDTRLWASISLQQSLTEDATIFRFHLCFPYTVHITYDEKHSQMEPQSRYKTNRNKERADQELTPLYFQSPFQRTTPSEVPLPTHVYTEQYTGTTQNIHRKERAS